MGFDFAVVAWLLMRGVEMGEDLRCAYTVTFGGGVCKGFNQSWDATCASEFVGIVFLLVKCKQ